MRLTLVCVLLVVVGAGLRAGPVAQRGASAPQATTLPAPDAPFDPLRDAAADIRTALAEARRTNRRVMLDVGGEWCSWCHTLDRYFVAHADLRELRDKTYVWLKVNWSPENTNEAVLSRYGTIEAYPWLFVLDPDGTLLVSQRTGPLEAGPSYDYDKMKAFLLKWAPPPRWPGRP